MLLPHIKVFWKTTADLELVSLPHFLHDFWWKIFLLLYSIIFWPNFISWLSLLYEILGNMCIAIGFLPGCDVINFEINLIFLIKPFFLCDQKVKIKIWISWERKGLSLKKIKQIFLEAESPTWTLSWRRSLSCRNQCKSMDWFLYDRDLRHERVKKFLK